MVRSPSVGLTCDNLLPRIPLGAILAPQPEPGKMSAEAPDRRGGEIRAARSALPQPAMRLLVDRRRQRADDRRGKGQAPPRRRHRARSLGLAAMLRRAMFAAVAGLVLSASNARAEEQVHRVGVLLSNQMGAAPRNAWLAGLRERGYVDGRNLQIDYRYHGGDVERMRALAAELAALAPELIVVGGRRPRSRCIPPPRPFRCSL